MNVVFDTNVLLSATLWDGSEAQKLLFKLINLDVKIFSSPEIIAEYQRILKRDFGYKDKQIQEITEKVFSFVNLINPKIKLNVFKKDPDDDKILECALTSKSKYIITYDKPLLKLKQYQNILILHPKEFLKLI